MGETGVRRKGYFRRLSMSILNKLYIMIGALIFVGGLVWFYGDARYDAGRADEKVKQAKYVDSLRADLKTAKEESASRIQEAKNESLALRREMNVLIENALKNDATFSDWHVQRVPALAADIFWMRDRGRDMPGRPGAVGND